MPAQPLKSDAVRALRQRLLQSEFRATDQDVFTTGFASLDRLLPQHGWPAGSIVEWISDGPGQAAMSLAVTCALPLLTKPGAFAVPDPERQFHPVAAAALGLPLSRLLLIRPDNDSSSAHVSPAQTALRRDTLWALEQLARCSGVRVIVCWLDRISSTALRRLQLAVERSSVTVFLVRPASAMKHSSWADLRLHVRSASDATARQKSSPSADAAASATRYAGTSVTVKLLRSRHAVLHHGSARFGIDDETSAVFEIPELARPASVAAAGE